MQNIQKLTNKVLVTGIILFLLSFAVAYSVKAETIIEWQPDVTKQIKQAIASKDDLIVFPASEKPYIVSDKLELKHPNQTIKLDPGVVVESGKGAYKGKNGYIFKIAADNVAIIGDEDATIKMRKTDYQNTELYPPSSNRHALVVRGAHDFKIADLNIADAGGDGIFIGANKSVLRTPKSLYSSGIVSNVNVTNPLRLGMSIMTAKGLVVTDSTFSGARGEKPASGVDVEPNPGEDWQTIQDIKFINDKFINNDRNGIQLGLGHYRGWKVKPVGISFINCVAKGNKEYGVKANLIKSGVRDQATGTISFSGLVAKNNKIGDIRIKSDVLPPYKSIGIEMIDSTAGTIELFKPKSDGKFANVDLGNIQGKLTISNAAKKAGLVGVTGDLIDD